MAEKILRDVYTNSNKQSEWKTMSLEAKNELIKAFVDATTPHTTAVMTNSSST